MKTDLRFGTVLEMAGATGVVGLVAAVLGRPSVTLVTSGAFVLWLAARFGSMVVPHIVAEGDPDRELLWNLLLTGVVVLGLIGVGLMAAPLTLGSG
jgi:hypothetical protein